MAKKRGPKSAADMTTAPVVALVPKAPPPPPEELTEAQAEVWRSVLSDLPPDWCSREGLPLLGAYCRQIASANRLAKQIDKLEAGEIDYPKTLAAYLRLLRMQATLSGSIATLAGKLRFSPSATIDPRTAGRAKANQPRTNNRPWTDE